jgi:hypothetical protein
MNMSNAQILERAIARNRAYQDALFILSRAALQTVVDLREDGENWDTTTDARTILQHARAHLSHNGRIL